MIKVIFTEGLKSPKTGLTIGLLTVLMYHGNAALALLIGAAIALIFDKRLIINANTIGTYALQTAIILLGLKLNASQLMQISADYSLLITCFVTLTLGLGLLIGRWFGNNPTTSQLIASGTAICGGTTIVSLSPVINARVDQTALALTMVFVLNALALLIFPTIGQYLNLSQEQFGVWAALAIHDTSSVMATAALYGDEAVAMATTVKLGRTLWLIPLLLCASLYTQRGTAHVRLPLFIVGFVLTAGLGSLVTLPSALLWGAAYACKSLLVLALFCIGTEINRATLLNLRGAAFMQGLVLWAAVVPASLAMVYHCV
ncbi:MAG: putative sulfate exporter family transporter [Porticoccaceae bacterium]|nr:putative sulfate exporter family transporter [Porticoccaceae bacterium]